MFKNHLRLIEITVLPGYPGIATNSRKIHAGTGRMIVRFPDAQQKFLQFPEFLGY